MQEKLEKKLFLLEASRLLENLLTKDVFEDCPIFALN